jgi:integral membrane sensor domain MASE1
LPGHTSRVHNRRYETNTTLTRGQAALLDAVRDWMFSWVGVICASALLAGMMVPVGLVVLLSLREDRAMTALSAGLWWLFGIILVHQIIPAARPEREHRESFGAAAWHASVVMIATVPVAWLLIFRSGLPAAYTITDVLMVAAYGGVFSVIAGIVMIWLRGHDIARTVRYTGISLGVAGGWGVLWLVLDSTLFATG